MTYDTNLTISLRGDTWMFDKQTRARQQAAQIVEIGRALYALDVQPPGLPASVEVDSKKLAVREDWLAHYTPRMEHDLHAMWSDGQSFLLIDKGTHVVKLDSFHTRLDPQRLVDGLATVPFQTACLAHDRFYADTTEAPAGWYHGKGLVGPHYMIGLGLALRGRGHLTLVSRRWLTHGGSWRVLRGPNDTTLVQLYDLGAADQHAAWAQASASYEKITHTMKGESGIVELRVKAYPGEPGGPSTYDPAAKRLWVLAGDRKVPLKEMRDVAEDRFNGTVKPPELWRPLQSVAYVFSSEARAKEHLHDLWLRELEVWYEANGKRVRLDDKYDPPAPPPPAWVTAAEAREAKARASQRSTTDRPATASPPPPAETEAKDAAEDADPELSGALA